MSYTRQMLKAEYAAGKRDFQLADFSSCDLSGLHLADADFSRAIFLSTRFDNAVLTGATLRGAYMRLANLHLTDLTGADLTGADLSWAIFSNTSLNYANLEGATLTRAMWQDCDLAGANFSSAVGWDDPIDWLAEHLERDALGYIAYKKFGLHYPAPGRWLREVGAILTETTNPDRTIACACGINVATHDWIGFEGNEWIDTWRVRIHWDWLAGVVVPLGTNGKFRAARVELLECIPATVTPPVMEIASDAPSIL